MASASSFTGDYSTGDLSQWTAIQRVATDRITVVATPAKQGQAYMARFEVRNGDLLGADSSNRAEVYAPDPTTVGFAEGEERYFGFATYLPADFPQEASSSGDKWLLCQQWKQNGTGSPPLCMEVDDHKLRLRRNLATAIDYWSTPIIRSRWVVFVLRVKFSSDPTIGFVELWMDGQQQDMNNAAQRMYGANMVGGVDSYWKQGIYRDPGWVATSVLYHAGSNWGSSYASVVPVIESAPVSMPRKIGRTRPRGALS